MDDAQFDTLVRVLAGGATRRGALAGLLGGTLVSMLPDAGTQARKRRKKKCKGATRCGKVCVNTLVDPANCGGCGRVCQTPNTCGGGNPGIPGVCGCTKTTCAAEGKNCGAIADGCGGTLECGAVCENDQEICGGGGTPNVCGCLPDGTVTLTANREACCRSSCCRDELPAGQCRCAGGCG